MYGLVSTREISSPRQLRIGQQHHACNPAAWARFHSVSSRVIVADQQIRRPIEAKVRAERRGRLRESITEGMRKVSSAKRGGWLAKAGKREGRISRPVLRHSLHSATLHFALCNSHLFYFFIISSSSGCTRRPELITLGIGVQIVGHDFLWSACHRCQEFVADVEIARHLADRPAWAVRPFTPLSWPRRGSAARFPRGKIPRTSTLVSGTSDSSEQFSHPLFRDVPQLE